MSRNLGTFGTEHDALDVDFDYFGTLIRVNPELSGLSLLEVLAVVAEFDEETPTKAVVQAIDDLRAVAIHEGDIDAFRKLFKVNRQSLDDLIDLAKALLEAVAEVPTVQPSGSSSGHGTTEQTSVVVSSAPGLALVRPDLENLRNQTEAYRAG